MNAIAIEAEPTVLAVPFGGGFFVGRIRVGDDVYGLIVAPKAEGETELPWSDSYDSVTGALSYNDGLANTQAMAAANSELGKWALGLNIGGHSDWYIPSQDELEIIYRSLKPTKRENYCYSRSGINLSAFDPTYPYTAAVPSQTQVDAFKEGGSEAFEPELYWSSTQHSGVSGYAWIQNFDNGYQVYTGKDLTYRARAVRRFKFSSLSI